MLGNHNILNYIFLLQIWPIDIDYACFDIKFENQSLNNSKQDVM